MSGQGVIGAAGIVAGTLASIGTEEHAAGIDDTLGQLLVVLDLQNEVLGGIEVREVDHLVDGIDEYVTTVFEGFGSHLLTGQQLKLSVDFDLYFIELSFACRNEKHLRVDAVFSLRQQVGSNEFGIGLFVS